jgi:hypothetical protein
LIRKKVPNIFIWRGGLHPDLHEDLPLPCAVRDGELQRASREYALFVQASLSHLPYPEINIQGLEDDPHR